MGSEAQLFRTHRKEMIFNAIVKYQNAVEFHLNSVHEKLKEIQRIKNKKHIGASNIDTRRHMKDSNLPDILVK